MLETFKKLFAFSSRERQPDNNSQSNSRTYQQSMTADDSETATRGHLVQIMMRDLVRKSGIPQGWVQCQIQVVNSRTRGQGIYVRLVAKHWDERLMRHAFAFQTALLNDIVQFEPQSANWLQGISWQLEVADSCPITELPAPKFWQTKDKKERIDHFEIIPMPPDSMTAPVTALVIKPFPALQPVVAAPVVPVVAAASSSLLFALEPLPVLPDEPIASESDTEQDLERLFAIRDKELENMALNNMLTVGYEKTEPAPL